MAQTRFQYDYSAQKGAERNAKRHCLSHEWETVIIQHPTTRRYIILMCDTPADLPTRVPILWRDIAAPPGVREHSDSDRMNALFEMIRDGVVTVVAQNASSMVHEDSLSDLCDDWINNGHIDWSEWENAP